jgi:hypothetical protein
MSNGSAGRGRRDWSSLNAAAPQSPPMVTCDGCKSSKKRITSPKAQEASHPSLARQRAEALRASVSAEVLRTSVNAAALRASVTARRLSGGAYRKHKDRGFASTERRQAITAARRRPLPAKQAFTAAKPQPLAARSAAFLQWDEPHVGVTTRTVRP